MASSSQKSSRYVSTKRRFILTKDPLDKPSENTINKDDVINQTTPTSSVAYSNGYAKQKSPNQSYSSRNALRAAQFNSGTNLHPPNNLCRPVVEPDMSTPKSLSDFSPIRDVDEDSSYELLNTDILTRIIGDDLYCMMCGIKEKIQSRASIEEHLSSANHNLNHHNLRITLLNQLPRRSTLQMEAIGELLATWYNTNSLTSEMTKERLEIINQFNSIISVVNPECELRIFGSLFTGTSLMSSDINLELLHPNSKLFEKDPRAKNSIHHKLIDPDAEYGNQINNHALHYDLIPNAIDTLYTVMNVINTFYQDQKSYPFIITSELNDLNRKVPRLILNHLPTGINLEVCCYATSRSKLSVFLNSYLSLDKRARQLSLLIKYWAHICNIDKPDQGTLPSDSFIVLAIYYLQRVTPPILPCLHELLSKGPKEDNNYEESMIKDFNGLDLLKNNHNNPKTDQDEKSAQAKTYTESVEGCLEAVEEELEDEDEEDQESSEFTQDDIQNINWNSTNDTPVDELFISFLLEMMKEFDDLSKVISIRTLKPVSLHSKSWGTQIKAIENPLIPKVNFARCIGQIRTFEYIRNCFRYGYYYLTSLPLDQKLKQRLDHQTDPRDYSELFINMRRFEDYFRMRAASVKTTPTYNAINEMVKQNLFAKNVIVTNALFDKVMVEHNTIQLLPRLVASSFQMNLLVPRDVRCTIHCGLCKRVGHIKSKCPKVKLENLQSESETYDETLDTKVNFDKIFIANFKEDAITPRHSAIHNDVLEKLETVINQSTNLNSRLQLFGSTVNNLGSRDSDLDICMTIADNRTGKGVNCVKILKEVCTVLNNVEAVKKIEPILSARVPILKFKYRKFEVDLSMYNQCATYNSKLLKEYSLIDDRVSQLFYLVKRYAKGCGIADASRGSLSSYAWSLMVIHFLQRTNPPILPILQEPDVDCKKEVIGVNGWNVWFRKNVAHPGIQNNSSLTRLFKEFFLYYGNFDFEFYVVSIRKSSPITRFQKNWNHCMMAIEDPFELTYNLASRLDDAMASYIINSFSQAYRHILRIQENHLKQHGPFITPTWFVANVFLFQGKEFTGSTPPYRGCRTCHRIGHKFKDCPDRKGKTQKSLQTAQ